MGLCLSSRLIKGDGEVLEEIVTKERHKEINKVVGTCHQHELLVGAAGEPLQPEALSCLLGDPADSTRANRALAAPQGPLRVGAGGPSSLGRRCCERPSLSLHSKPPGGTGWPSRRGRGCCSEHTSASRAGSLSCCRRQPRREPVSGPCRQHRVKMLPQGQLPAAL